MSAIHTLRVDPSMTDDDLRTLAGRVGLGKYVTTARTGIGRRVFMFEQGLVERRRRSITLSFDGLEVPGFEARLRATTADLHYVAS